MDIIDINIGCVLQAQLISGNSNLRADVQYIGCLPGKHVFVSAPEDPVFISKLTVSDRIVIRYLDERNILGFESRVLSMVNGKDSFLQLKYPAKIERVVLRKNERIPVKIDVNVMKGDVVHKGVISNLSSTGALLFLPIPLAEVDDNIQLSFAVQFGVLKNSIYATAVIRNVTETDTETPGVKYYKYGIEFLELSEQELLYVQGSIYEHMARNRMIIEANT